MKCHTCGKEIIPPNYKVTNKGEFCCSSECYHKAIGAHLTMPVKEVNQTTDGYPALESFNAKAAIAGQQIDTDELLKIIKEHTPDTQGVSYPPVKSHDPVNHPAHYTSHPSGVECIQITRHMTFNCGNAVKYLWRNGLKDGAPSVQDLKKAIWYINDEIKRIENDLHQTSAA